MILSYIYTSKILRDYAKKVASGNDLWQDIITEMVLYLSQIDEKKLKDLYDTKQIIPYCCKIIHNSWNSPTSPFYKKYISKEADLIYEKPQAEPAEDIDYEKLLKELEEENTEYPYGITLLRRYSELNSYTKLHNEIKDKTGQRIPYTTLIHIINDIRIKVKQKI
jgi:hypothetical protein